MAVYFKSISNPGRAAFVLALLLALGATLAGVAAALKESQAAKARLAPLQPLIGEWKGVGQPQRGSTKGAWQEKVGWAWKHGERETAISAAFDQGKYFKQARLMPGSQAGEFALHATLAADSTSTSSETPQEVIYTGKQDDAEQLILTTNKVPEGAPARISIRLVASGDRLLVLYEKRLAADQYARLAEVGYTRVGSGFGQGTSGRECVVTGGAGAIAVMHEGQTYYVCCTGCREYFNDNPAKVIAEYHERRAAEKAERERTSDDALPP